MNNGRNRPYMRARSRVNGILGSFGCHLDTPPTTTGRLSPACRRRPEEAQTARLGLQPGLGHSATYRSALRHFSSVVLTRTKLTSKSEQGHEPCCTPLRSVPLTSSRRSSLGCLFRQLRSFRCFRSSVGSHISAFNCCKSQSRQRVSQSIFSLQGLWPVPRLPVRRRKSVRSLRLGRGLRLRLRVWIAPCLFKIR